MTIGRKLKVLRLNCNARLPICITKLWYFTVLQDMISIILAITFLIFSYNEMMPRVSYIKAMDIYLGE